MNIINQKDWIIAANILRNGGVVAFPTDTVYGLGCRYDDFNAQTKLRNAKNRPEEKSFPLVVGSMEQLKMIAETDDRIEKIVHHFLPGALTLILKKKNNVEDWVTDGKATIAIRMIDVVGINEMIQSVGVPLFLTSANISGEPVCRNAQEVLDKLGNKIDCVIDGKHIDSLASTILDCTKKNLTIVRQGPIGLEDILKILEEK